MSKKKIVNKRILKGKFYAVHDGSKKGHPGKLYWKNDNRNLYLFIKIGTTPVKENIALIIPTKNGLEASYVYKRPLLAKRKDVGGELPDLRIAKKDKKMLREISTKSFTETSNIKKRDRQYIKRLKKKPKM